MASVHVVPASNEPAWLAYTDRLTIRDIFYHPAYYALNAAILGYEAELFAYSEESERGNMLVYPYYKKPIDALPFSSAAEAGIPPGPYWDISTLEHGGPACASTPDPAFVERALAAFSRHCQESNYVTEFSRLHPFLENHAWVPDAQRVKRIFIIDLTQPLETIRGNMEKRCRNAISKAERNGVVVEHSRATEDIDAFYAVYARTMDKHEAERFYYYNRPYFDALFEKLGGLVHLFIAKKDGKPIAGSLFIGRDKILHYYLSGSDRDASALCPNNLVLWRAIQCAKALGFTTFNFGGGYGSGEDSLSRFKSSFTSTSLDFYRVSRVHNVPVYAKLRDSFKKFVEEHKIPSRDYFPVYRGCD